MTPADGALRGTSEGESGRTGKGEPRRATEGEPGRATEVGLLQCDHVAARFAAVTPDYDVLFRTLVDETDAPIRWRVFDAVNGDVPTDPRACDAWLVTGSSYSAYDDEPWIHALEELLREVHAAARPIVGVCFGHQLLAQALGGTVQRADTGWGVGTHRTELRGGDAWDLLYMHQDQVMALPPDGELLASSDHCPMAMFVVGPHTFGVQAHPEFTAAYTEALLTDRALRIGDERVAAGIASLATPPSRAAAAHHVANVLLGAPPDPS